MLLDWSPSVQDYQEFQIIVHQIEGILPYKFPVYVTISDV
jgi:hypothetical protein